MIGILGGIGSGKSTVVRHVTDLQLEILDADKIGHELLETLAVQEQVGNAFGTSIFRPDGTIDRSELAKRVFDPTGAGGRSLKQLEEILHPAIRRTIHEKIQQASRDVDAFILDAALLLEAGWAAECDGLIFIETPRSIRLERVRKTRGWSEQELSRRESAQWSTERKREHADFVVDNSGAIDEAAVQMKQALTSIINRHSHRSS